MARSLNLKPRQAMYWPQASVYLDRLGRYNVTALKKSNEFRSEPEAIKWILDNTDKNTAEIIKGQLQMEEKIAEARAELLKTQRAKGVVESDVVASARDDLLSEKRASELRGKKGSKTASEVSYSKAGGPSRSPGEKKQHKKAFNKAVRSGKKDDIEGQMDEAFAAACAQLNAGRN